VHDLTCDEVQDAAPQFALDILEPSARADVAAHLIRCPGCREDVSEMQESAARLLDLSEVPPTGPAGSRPGGTVPGGPRPALPASGERYFDEYFLGDEYFGPGPGASAAGEGVRPGRRRVRLVITLAAVAALVVGTALGPELSRPLGRPAVPLASAQLLQTTRAVGTVNFYAHHTPAVELAVKGVAAKGWLTCELVGLDGTVVALGSFKLYEGSGYWGSTTRLDPTRVASIDLVDAAGHLVAAAGLA
jgi:hypothetical protein